MAIEAAEAAAAAGRGGGDGVRGARAKVDMGDDRASDGDGGGGGGIAGGRDDSSRYSHVCCEKHAYQLQRSAVNAVEERVAETSNKVCVR